MTLSTLLLVPLDDNVVFPNMNVTIAADVADEIDCWNACLGQAHTLGDLCHGADPGLTLVAGHTSKTRSSSATSAAIVTFMLGKTTLSSSGTSSSVLKVITLLARFTTDRASTNEATLGPTIARWPTTRSLRLGSAT